MLASQHRAINQINDLWDSGQYRVARIIKNRARRRGLQNRFLANRDELMGYLAARPAPRDFKDLSDAIMWFRREIRRHRGLAANGHWAFCATILCECRDRLVIARYFRLLEASEALEAAQEREAA